MPLKTVANRKPTAKRNAAEARTNTAESLYRMAKRLPVIERRRLAERIARDLRRSPHVKPAGNGAPKVRTTRTCLLGEVTAVSFEPPQFTINARGEPVTVHADRSVLNVARDALGMEASVIVNAVVDPTGAILRATAQTIEVCAEADDPAAALEATFGSGRDAWSCPEAQHFLATMRGGSL